MTETMTADQFRQRFRGKRGRGRGVKHKAGVMNGLETAWAAQLDMQLAREELTWWRFEAITLKLAPDTRFTPDFASMRPDGVLVLDDVKGGLMEDDAWVKLKVAAEMFPLVFRLVRRKAKKDGGGWDIKEIG